MHEWSISELQGVSAQQGVSTRRTTQDGASRSSRWRRGAVLCGVCPSGAAPVWAWWLVLSALVVPGVWSFLSEEQEELLVELHNHYRGLVSPSASAMMPLKWDPSLKLIAEGYATKCVWNHNPELEDTGENLFAGTGPLDLREALEKWFLEHHDYNFHNNSCDEDKMCGHYTQMVWADTHRVGCAFHLCNNMEGLQWERVSYLVCNYFPAGNYEGERPYVEGDWCSRCPENLQQCENNLCVDDFEEEDGTDWATLAPHLVTSDPALHHEEQGDKEEEEEEKVVPPPPATTEVEPSTTFIPILISEDTPPPVTTPPNIYSTGLGEEERGDRVLEEEEEEEEGKKEEEREDEMLEEEVKKEEEREDTVLGEEMKKEEEVTEEEVTEEEVKEEEVKKEEERKDTLDKTDREREIEEARKRHQIPKVRPNSGSVSSPSLLLASLTGILSLRL
ncbi:peptidase inhibitor 16 [Paralichthys olivaceus]|uniref:peptidase inhibitor 16 n=1 Tax=Paralichthys olivaceus TaxID=8255 RepID=UPI00375009F1